MSSEDTRDVDGLTASEARAVDIAVRNAQEQTRAERANRPKLPPPTPEQVQERREQRKRKDAGMPAENIRTKREAADEFMEQLRECVRAVSEGEIAELDVEREIIGLDDAREQVRITIRREPFRA